jgi:hypothetical protein
MHHRVQAGGRGGLPGIDGGERRAAPRDDEHDQLALQSVQAVRVS